MRENIIRRWRSTRAACEAGMTTAEYAVGTLAAVTFSLVLLAVVAWVMWRLWRRVVAMRERRAARAAV